MAFKSVSLLLLSIPTAFAFQNCPIHGPAYPKPGSFESETIRNGIAEFTKAFEQGLKTGKTGHGPVLDDSAYSMIFFSANDEKPLFEKHYTPNVIAKSKLGTNKIDGDSVYRVGSVSKLLTVYTFLAEVGDKYWDRHITEFLPELASHAEASHKNPIAHTGWEDITLGALASHTAGINRDLGTSALQALEFQLKAAGIDPKKYGLPELKPSDASKCLLNTTMACKENEFLDYASGHQPVYLPNTTPVYSDTSFQMLAYVLERITGKSFPQHFEQNIVKALGLTGTSYQNPSGNDRGVIPGDISETLWNADLGETTPAGGMFSTPNDLFKIGRSLLRSSILCENTTRGWMQPVSHTASLELSVGRPWEIYRYKQPSNGRITDIYTKDGGLGAYGAEIVLLPEYGFGYVLNVAGEAATIGPHGSHYPLDGLIAEHVLPTLEAHAREEAAAQFAGQYGDQTSGIELGTRSNDAGLGIKTWMSQGVDMLAVLGKLKGLSGDDKLSAHLYPTDLVQQLENGSKRMAFRAVYEVAHTWADTSVFVAAQNCGQWFTMDQLTYGDWSIDEFIFTLNEKGEATAVEPKFLRSKLNKVKSG